MMMSAASVVSLGSAGVPLTSLQIQSLLTTNMVAARANPGFRPPIPTAALSAHDAVFTSPARGSGDPQHTPLWMDYSKWVR